MAEKLNLNNYKSSGVYTIEVDESQNLSLPISTGRLIIGSSKKGPINSVVLIDSTRTNRLIYGETDTKLEKKGSYFHRTIDVALREGPVYAMNVLPVDDDDTAYYTTFNTESGSNNSVWNATRYNDSMSHFYNTQKLWFADGDMVNKWKNINLGDDYLLNPSTHGSADKDANKILTLVNLSRKDITAWVRLASVSGYDITVKEYYALLGNDTQIPEYLNIDDFVKDYFIEVIVVEGDWTNYQSLSSDPVYSEYFNADGIINSKIDEFIALREITLYNQSIGCIIPEFRDLSNTIVAIDTVFNRKFAQSGIYLAIDYNKIEMMDLSNSTFDSGSSTEPIENQRLDLIGYGVDDLNITSGLNDTYTIDDGITGTNAVALIDILSYKKPIDSTYHFKLDTYSETYANNKTYISEVGTIIATENSKLYNAWMNGFIESGDIYYLVDTPATYYLGCDGVIYTQSETSINYIVFNVYKDITRIYQETRWTADNDSTTDDDYLKIEKSNASAADAYKRDFDLKNENYFCATTSTSQYSYQAPNVITFTLNARLYGNPNKNETANTAVGFPYDSANRAEIDEFFKVGRYIKARVTTGSQRNRMLRIESVYAQKITDSSYGPSGSAITTLKYTVTVKAPNDPNTIGVYFDTTNDQFKLRVYKGIPNYATNLVGYKIPAMVLDDINLYPNGTAAMQNTIMDFLLNSSNLGETISDNETLDIRYLIDSYEGQIYPGSKQQLAQIAANHGKLLVIANAPSFAQYEKSVDPSFIDLPTRLISTEFISTGGDISSNPEFLFKFATGEKNGIPLSSYTSYFMPNIVIYENGKNKSIPPAMYVANAYMKKYNSGNTFSIVAGKRGILSDPEIVGVEYDLTNTDRDYLEPAGFNLIVRRRGFGVMVFSNNTAYQKVNSALNNIHVREALITIEKDIERILLNFLFDFNDTVTRMRVKTMVNNYLEAVKDARGISWFDVIFDDSNNGTEVLENNAGVVDILVDFPRGIHKFINRITRTRVGGKLSSQSTGFTPSF